MANTGDTRSRDLERRGAKDPQDPFFDGLAEVGKLTRVGAELETGAPGAAPRGPDPTPGRGPSVADEMRRAPELAAPAGGGAQHDMPGEGDFRGAMSELQMSRLGKGPSAIPVRTAALQRTFGGAGDVPIETGASAPSSKGGGESGARGYALGGRAFIAAAEPDLAHIDDRLVIGHEVAHAIQQRRGDGLEVASFNAPMRAQLEAEAVAAASAFASGQRFAVTGRAPAQVALFDDPKKQVVRMTLLGDLVILELDDHTKETVKTISHGQLEAGNYTYDPATKKVGKPGAAAGAEAPTVDFYPPRDAKLDGLPSIPLEVSFGGRGGANAAHRVQADPALAVAMPGTKVKYYVAMDPEIGGSYTFRWYCINDPASVGGNIPPRVDGPTEYKWDAQWAVPGRHTVVLELTFHGTGVPDRTEKLQFFQQVSSEQQIRDNAFNNTQAPEYMRFRAAVELQNMALLDGALHDQKPAGGGPYIDVAGQNPAVPGTAPNLAHNTYTIHPSPKAKKFRWYARCASWDGMPTQNYYGHQRIQVDGQDALDLNSQGPTAQLIIASYNKFTVIAEELDDQGLKLGSRATYVQVVESQDQADKQAQWQKYMKNADGAMGKIAEGKEVGLHAVYINRESGEQVSMQLYAGPSAGDPGKIALVDLLPGVDRLEYSGNNIEDALNDFANGNAYPKGSIRLEVPANKSGIPSTTKTLETKGESLWSEWSKRIGWASLGLAAGGVVAALIPGGQPVAAALFIAAAATGVAAGSLDLYDRLQKAEKSPIGIALDVAGIAASIVGGATAFRALRVGAALTFTGTAGKFLFYAGFVTNGVAGLLITVEGVDEISKILDSQMPRGEKISAIVRILANLVVQGFLLALSVRDVNQMRGRIGALIGEEAASGLAVDVLHSLNLLDDAALKALKGVAKTELTAVAELARLNPGMANRLVRIAGGTMAEHTIVPNNELVSFDGQIRLDPAKLATMSDEEIKNLMQVSKTMAEGGKPDEKLLQSLTGSTKPDKSPGLRLRFESQLGEGNKFVEDVGATRDPRSKGLFNNMTDRERTRLYDLVNSDRPSGATEIPGTKATNIDKQASDWALSKSPKTVSDYVSYVEMYLQKFKDRIAAETDEYNRAVQAAIDAGESKKAAQARLSQKLFGEPVDGTGKTFKDKLGKKIEAEFGLPGDSTKAGPGAGVVQAAYSANAEALKGHIGMSSIGTAASEAETIARVRALPEVKFSNESAAAYHVEKHNSVTKSELPPSEITGTTPALRVKDYLASAAKTVKTGSAVAGVNQDGVRTVTFTRAFEEGGKPYSLQAIVFLTEDGNAFFATYFNRAKK